MIKSYFNLPKYRATIFLVLALLVLYVISRYNYLLFHSLADGVSIVIAACVFVIIWNGRRIVDNDYFLYVGIAFLFFAFWDLMHLLGNKNMGVFPKYGNLGPVLYIVSRYILSISLIIAPLFINRKINTTLMYAAYSLLTLLILLSIFYWQIFPVCIVEGVGLTPFKVVSDYIICLILLGAIGLLLINRRSFDSRVLWIIVSSIILSIATGLAFTLYADPFGIMNAIGHFFQIASFYLIYLAFIETSLTKPQDILYQKLKKNEEKLLENFEQLNNANAVLEQEVTERKQTEEALQEAHEHLERRVEERTIQLRQEIEAHKRLQLTLRENEEKFRTVADWTYDWEYWIDPQDRVLLYISPSVERITGYAPEAFLADSGLMDRIVHPDDRSLWDRHGEENQSKTDSIELTFRIITASGEVCWLGHECQAVIAADGRPLGRRASNRDITRQKLAEEELRKSEERLQLAIQAADVGIFEFDIVNNRLTWDETMCRFYGITPDKFGGNHEAWVERIHPEDLPQVLEAVQRALRDEGKFKPEFRIVWPDGSIHWIKADARIERDSEGRALRVTGASLDITADKLSVEAAQSASRAKSLFIGNMSHELRTPLSAVLGMTDLLLNTPVTDKQRGYAETIRKSGKALLIVVSDILDFSKIEAGKMDLESSPFLVEAVIANVVNLFGPPAAEEKIGLRTTIDQELPAVRGDAHRLTQVISNLVGNAVKFTKAGEIRVSVKILRRTEAEVNLAISVKDTGIGMTEEELSRIFTPFTQGDTTIARRFGGTGLGLTISRNLVELMGGTLQVESVFGKGSLFTVLVTFPVAEGFARRDLKFVPINPVAPATPARPELPPGDMAELQTLLEQIKKPLDNGEPMPCKEILAVLLQKSWPEEQETLLAELDRLVKRYRLQEALDLLNAEK